MSVTLDATPKGLTSNSYATLAEANAYMDNRVFVTVWNAQTDDNKCRALIWATNLLDESMTWVGFPRTIPQRLRWPRSGAQNPDGIWYDYDTIPEVLKGATAELAQFLLSRDRTLEPKLFGQGFSDVGVGPVRLTVDKSMVLALIPDSVLAKLQFIGSVDGIDQGGGRTVKLVRT